VTQHFSPNPETTSNLFETYDTVASAVFKPTIDNEDNAETVISNHLHSVKSLKKFFETKMVVQRPMPINDLPMNPAVDEQKSTMKTTDQLEQRQEMMNQVLESLKQTKAYSRLSTGKNPSCPFNSIANFSHLETPESNGRCSAMTTSSYESNLAQNLPVQRHYSRRFRSSSTSYTSFSSNGNIITHIHLKIDNIIKQRIIICRISINGNVIDRIIHRTMTMIICQKIPCYGKQKRN